MKDTKIKLSVIIPVYNDEANIINAICSIPLDSYIELIIIDDGSTDNTNDAIFKAIEPRLEWGDQRIVVCGYGQNKGVSRAVNEGLDKATGEYVVLLGSDDYFYPTELQQAIRLFDGTDLIYFNMLTNDNQVIESTPLQHPHGSVKFMRREFIGDTRNREDLRAGEDYYFYRELLRKRPTEKFTPLIVKHYNYPKPNSLSDLVIKGKLKGIDMKVSVVIPLYNQEELVVKALDSIPIRDDIEVLVCDDKSTDNSLEVVKRYKITHPLLNMRIIENEENIGLGATKNVLFDNARGEYINQLDSDDYLYTEEYNKVIDMLDGSDMVYVNLQKNDGGIFEVTPESKRGICGGPARFIRREFLGDTRCYPIRAAEDLYLNNKLLDKNPTELFTGITTYHYNFPREGSLYDLFRKGEIKVDIKEENND